MSRLPDGFSLIDVIVGVALMLVLFLALFGVLRTSLILSTLAKAEAAGTELANTQMEYLHGLAYSAVGTVGGIPAGSVPQIATSTVDGVAYTMTTFITYYDDPADGTGTNDTNQVTTDYKKGKVTVSYTMYGLARSIVLVSNFVPPGIEANTDGGTLAIHVVNKANTGVSGAAVQIVNASTSPTINFTTLSDVNGNVLIGGVATSSQFQIYVSLAGYSSAQTYARTGQNANPTPGYLTVTENQTTSATFAIDLLGNLILSSFSPATTTLFSDLFNSSAQLASQTNTQVTGSALTLVSPSLSGSALSTTTTPNYLDGWGILTATPSTPGGTTAVVRVDAPGGTPLPNSVLPGNSAGFSSFPVSLTGVSTTTYPSLSLEADFTSAGTTTDPSLLDWSLSYTTGPAPLANTAFTLTGAKTIGTTANGNVIYKTIVNGTTGASASVNETLEWDAYTPTLSTSALEICPTTPFGLSPGATLPESLIVGNPLGTTLPVVVTDGSGNPLASATVVLSKSGYAATQYTSACGLAYFDGIPNGTYSASITDGGYGTQVFPNITVSGRTATSTLAL